MIRTVFFICNIFLYFWYRADKCS